jgi:hypothetical protein
MQNAEPLGLRILRITPQAVCHNLIVTTSKRSHHLSVKIPTPKPRTNRLLTSPSLATQLFQNQDFSIPYKRQTTPKQPPSASSRTPLLYHANSPQKQRSAGLPCRRIGEAHKPSSKRIRPRTMTVSVSSLLAVPRCSGASLLYIKFCANIDFGN